jgi:hypothetical protein
MAYTIKMEWLHILNTASGLSAQIPLPGLGEAVRPSWHPDGRHLAFGSGARIFTVKDDGTELYDVPTTAGHPVEPNVSPDGRFIAYQQLYGSTHIVDWDGANDRDLGVYLGYPRWSPDGRRILGTDWPGDNYQSDLFLYDLETAVLTRLTHHQPGEAFQVGDFSPDGSRIVTNRRDPDSGHWQIAVMNADGTGVTTLTADWSDTDQNQPTWSPDGQWLLFASDRGGRCDAWAMRPDGSNRVKLTDDDTLEFPQFFLAPEPSDDFQDGVLHTGRWAVGGSKRGVGGFGGGSWIWSVEESQGAVQARVAGPASGGTYGADAWLRSRYDYNDGANHLIEFTWGFAANATHVDIFAIQFATTEIPENSNVFWMCDNKPPGQSPYQNLYLAFGDSGFPGQTNAPPTRWSILLDAPSRTATLFSGPSATGVPIGQRTLDPAQPWHLRFVVADATSSGYPAGDDSLYVYDYTSRTYPVPVTIALYAGITIAGNVGQPYRIEYRTDIDAIAWTLLATNTLTSPSQTWIDFDSPGKPRRFYRVVFP